MTARRMLPLAVALSMLFGLLALPSDADEADESDDPDESSHVVHVSPGGDDPLERALDDLGPGDTLIVHGGEYREHVRLIVRPGRSDAPIRVRAASGERPVVRGILSLRGLSWWRIEGINVTWDNNNSPGQHMVKLIDGHDWSFTDAELWGARSYAALLISGEPARFRISELYVHDTYPSNGLNQDHLIYLNCGDGGGVVERNLLVGSHNGRAIKIGSYELSDDQVANVTIRYNTMVDNTGPSNVQLTYRASDIRMYRNIMVGPQDDRPNVTAFELRGSHNVVEDNVGFGGTGVVEPGVLGLVDGGGNREVDPQLSGSEADRPFAPTTDVAENYGRWAD